MERFLKYVKEHYLGFNGRARREEYWTFTLMNITISIMLSVMFNPISGRLLSIASLHSLVVLLPALGAAAQRLHDINRSGRWMLIALIPIVGLYLTYPLTKDSNVGQNQYGQNPKGIA